MKKRTLVGGGWFDADSAKCYGEAQYFDGRNHCSVNTHSQWIHHELYHTRRGRWVLGAWSQWQGSGPERFMEITERDAARWLVRNGHEVPSALAHLVEADER